MHVCIFLLGEVLETSFKSPLSDLKSVRSKTSPSSTEIQQKSNQYDSILSQLDLIHRHLNDIDHRVDDFNYRLKVLENLSVSKQHQYQPTEDSYKKSIHCDDGLRF
ncbi:unnamed protein product [Rotaria socialis]|uniref:Uncharacterized protein n=2 Tax=Rotaria socialis TaxID=392032 RepID=A0A820AB72_9BILA|nr:unnamed protein product [Rotaria socialis]CAF4704193.1 unnamed protein product [Rotaria socialis]